MMVINHRQCKDCGRDISDLHHNCTKCKECQITYRAKISKKGMKNIRKLKTPEYIIRLGGRDEATLEKICNYKGKPLKDNEFKYCNEADLPCNEKYLPPKEDKLPEEIDDELEYYYEMDDDGKWVKTLKSKEEMEEDEGDEY